MFQALKNSPLGSTTAWIPVREADDRSGPMPFDFTVRPFNPVVKIPYIFP